MRVFLLFTYIFLMGLVGVSYASCEGEGCAEQPDNSAAVINLHPQIINQIQSQFGGRILGVSLSANCKRYTTEIIIDERPQQAYGYTCKDPAGSWKEGKQYDVQVLKPNGSLLIITIDPRTSQIVLVRE